MQWDRKRIFIKRWNADNADASSADEDGTENPRKSALENPFYQRSHERGNQKQDFC